MPEAKFAIIGRGLAGLNLALRMAERGLRPLVFGAARGSATASRCAQGIICNKGLIFAESPLFQAKLSSIRRLQPWLNRLESLSGLNIPHQMQGVYEPYWDEEDFQKTVRRVYRGNFWGCYRARNQPGKFWQPAISRHIDPLGFLSYPDDGWFDVGSALDALELASQRMGAKFLDETVSGIVKQAKGLLVHAGGQSYPVGHLVLAAGAGTENLLGNLGLDLPKSFLVGGQSLSWAHPKPILEESRHRVLVKATLSLAVGDQRSILGSTSWKHNPQAIPDLDADAAGLLAAADKAFGLRLSPAETEDLQSAWGVRLRFGDRMPALGRWPEPEWSERLSVLTGFYKNGLQLADICAEQLFRELQGLELDSFGEAFHFQRFFKTRFPLKV